MFDTHPKTKKFDSANCDISYNIEISLSEAKKLESQGKLTYTPMYHFYKEGYTISIATFFKMWQKSANIIECDCFETLLLINENE